MVSAGRGLNEVAILGRRRGSHSLLQKGGAQSVLLSDGFLVCMAAFFVRSSWEAFLVCMRIE